MSALVKLGMLFAGGVTVGLVIPWGFGASKPRPDDASERTVNVRCIVEYGDGVRGAAQGQAGPGQGVRRGRFLPRPDDVPTSRSSAPPVEVVIKPGQKGTADADDVTVILRVKPSAGTQAAGDAPADRPMPGAM